MWNFAIANCDLPASFVKATVDVVMSDNAADGEYPPGGRVDASRELGQEQGPQVAPRRGRWFRENAGADIPDDMVYGGS